MPGGAIGRLPDLGDVGEPGIAGGGRLLEEAAEARDDGHHVVHFVRHATGDLRDRFHPLGLNHQLVGPPPLGDVDDDDARRSAPPVGAADRVVAGQGDEALPAAVVPLAPDLPYRAPGHPSPAPGGSIPRPGRLRSRAPRATVRPRWASGGCPFSAASASLMRTNRSSTSTKASPTGAPMNTVSSSASDSLRDRQRRAGLLEETCVVDRDGRAAGQILRQPQVRLGVLPTGFRGDEDDRAQGAISRTHRAR